MFPRSRDQHHPAPHVVAEPAEGSAVVSLGRGHHPAAHVVAEPAEGSAVVSLGRGHHPAAHVVAEPAEGSAVVSLGRGHHAAPHVVAEPAGRASFHPGSGMPSPVRSAAGIVLSADARNNRRCVSVSIICRCDGLSGSRPRGRVGMTVADQSFPHRRGAGGGRRGCLRW